MNPIDGNGKFMFDSTSFAVLTEANSINRSYGAEDWETTHKRTPTHTNL